MLRKMVSYFTLPLLLLLSNSPENSATSAAEGSQGQNGTLERMIVANGIVAMDLDLNQLKGISSDTQESRQSLRFEVSSETFAQNQNANALRWGTLYNFRFDSNRAPQAANATISFFKTGGPITVAIQAPSPSATLSRCPECSRGH